MKELTVEQKALCNQLDVIRSREEKIGKIISRTAGYSALAGVVLSLAQCGNSCYSYNPSVDKSYIGASKDMLSMNNMDLEDITLGFEHRLSANDFIKNNPELATSLEQAKNEALEAKVASDKLYAQFKETPEFQQYFSAEEKASSEFMTGLGILTGALAIPAFGSWGAHSINGAVARRRSRPIEKRLDELRN